MKCYVWLVREGYSGAFLMAIADNADRARELIAHDLGYTHSALAGFPDELDLTTEAVYTQSFG
jgi:hypothetical protein